MIELEKYYTGDEHWNSYAEAFDEHWIEDDIQKKLLEKLEGDIQLAKVINYHLVENSISWLYDNIPALDNLKPIECLKKRNLILRLRECLMRFPC